MNFRDRWETDADGNRFIFTVEMQRRLDEQGLAVEPASLAQLANVTIPPANDSQPEPSNGRSDRQERQPRNSYKEREQNEIEEPTTIQIDPQTGKYIGRMKWYNSKKGYGFIMRGAGEEIFFHKSNIMGEPEDFPEGQWILYDVETTGKGPEATDVEPYEGDTSALS